MVISFHIGTLSCKPPSHFTYSSPQTFLAVVRESGRRRLVYVINHSGLQLSVLGRDHDDMVRSVGIQYDLSGRNVYVCERVL